MKFAGLSGGIGAGKSTVAAALARRGAVVIDVDRLSREIERPGEPVFDAIVARWGPTILTVDGQIDRPALGRVVFADPRELGVLTVQITGPAIAAALVEQAGAYVDTDSVVVLEAAMLPGRDRRLYGLKGVVVVDAPTETAVRRLIERRGMAESDARARIARQLDRDERLRQADFIIDNSGPGERLGPQIEAAWEWMLSLPDAVPVLDT